MSWNLNPEYPIYTQIMEHITSDIISGNYAPGSKLPSVRELAQTADRKSTRLNSSHRL